MNIWLQKSIRIANQTDYLDQLFKVYPMANNINREISDKVKASIEHCFDAKDNIKLLEILLKQDIFPVKDSYVAYLKRDKTAIERNPKTIDRLAGMIYELGYHDTIKSIIRPIETNRQIGPLFKYWLENGSLGMNITNSADKFLSSNDNAALIGGDSFLGAVARKHFGYTHEKGLDFLCRANNTIILAETKFLTDFGGHQNAQFNDAMSTLQSTLKHTEYNVKIIAILDGVVYISSKNKMYKSLQRLENNEIVISALLLRDYLYSL
jgi:hypothetical protein